MHFYIWYKSSFDYLVTCYQTHIAFLDLWNPKIGIIIDLKIPHTYIWCKERTEMLWIYCGKIFLQQYHYHLDTNVIFLKHHLETDAKDVRQSLSIALGMICYYLKIDHCCCKAFVIPLLCWGWNLLSLCIKASFFTLLLFSFPPSHFLFFLYHSGIQNGICGVRGIYWA